jgi:sugar lactone lactonase YvrE
MTLSVSVCGILLSLATQAQSTYEPYSFSTLAGNPPGSTDGGGVDARFYYDYGVAVDSAGNAYVADVLNHTIRKITPSGVVSTLAGLAGKPGSADGTGSAARFNQPNGVAVDNAGNVYVGDSVNDTIRKITPAGVVSTLAGLAGQPGSVDGTGSAARFDYPVSVAVDGPGNVYVADQNNHTIRKITPAGVVTTLAGFAGHPGSADGTGSAARFYFPDGVTVDSSGTVYEADSASTIRVITPAGVVSTLAGLPFVPGTDDGTGRAARFNQPFGVAVDGAGNIYTGDFFNHTIRKVTSVGVVTTLAGLPEVFGSADGIGSAARFTFPAGVAVDSANKIYVADSNNSTVRKVTLAGVVTTLAGLANPGSNDGPRNVARFFSPAAVAVDSARNAYVADRSNSTIRKITSAGVVSTLAGLAGSPGSDDGTGSAARFDTPAGAAVDSAGNVYVGDQNNHTIRKISATGVVITLAGLAGSPGSADGTGSAARFNFPRGVAVDGTGNVYVADSANDTIRKITPAGVVITLAGRAGHPGSADGTGSAARFNFPVDVAVDSAGLVYVGDALNDTIRKITAGSVVSTLAGRAGHPGTADGSGSAARFNIPDGVAVDGAGNLYVGDSNNDTIRKITPAGVVTTLAGLPEFTGFADGSGKAARFYAPRRLAVDNAGQLYVPDIGNNVIRIGRARH